MKQTVEEQIAILKRDVDTLKKRVLTLSEENFQLAFTVERQSLKLAEIESGIDYYAIVQDAVCQTFEVTQGQVMGLFEEFADAWLHRTPNGIDTLLFGKGQEMLTNRIVQARVMICCFHRFVFLDKRRTHGELEITYKWYSRRKDRSLRKIFGSVLSQENKHYAEMYRRFEIARRLIQERVK